MNWQKLNKQAVSFCAVGILFIGSLYYFVSIAFQNRDILESRQAGSGNEYKDLY